MNKKFRWFLTLSSKNDAIWLIFECARSKTARKSWDLPFRCCWVALEISTLRTSPRMEVPLDRTYLLTNCVQQTFLSKIQNHDSEKTVNEILILIWQNFFGSKFQGSGISFKFLDWLFHFWSRFVSILQQNRFTFAKISKKTRQIKEI